MKTIYVSNDGLCKSTNQEAVERYEKSLRGSNEEVESLRKKLEEKVEQYNNTLELFRELDNKLNKFESEINALKETINGVSNDEPEDIDWDIIDIFTTF